MAVNGKVIITCAVTGAIHTPVDVAASADHAGGDRRRRDRRGRGRRRDRPSPRAQSGRRPARPVAGGLRPFLQVIKQRSDCVVNITTGGCADHDDRGARPPGRDLQAGGRLAQHGLDEFRPLSDARSARRTFKYDWERPYLEGSRERIFKNTFTDIEYILSTCAENGTRFEIECYDIGHLYTLATSPTAGWSSRRSSSSRCSASSAASARIPRTSRT